MSSLQPRRILPQGGISSGDSILITTFINNTLYVYTTSGFVPAYDGTTLASNIIIFTITINPEYVTFNSNSGNGALTYNSTGLVVTMGTNPLPVFLNQKVYTPVQWNEVTAGILYYPSGISSGGSSSIALNFTVQGITDPEYLQIAIVPARYYTNCSTSGSNTVQTDLTTPLALMQCSYYPSTSFCSNYSGKTAWTNEELCIQGNTFDYCSVGTFCSGTCNSVCSNSTQQCVLNGNNNYECEGVTETVFVNNNLSAPPTPPTRPWVWIILVIAIIFIIGILVWFFWFDRPNPAMTNSNIHTASYHHHDYA